MAAVDRSDAVATRQDMPRLGPPRRPHSAHNGIAAGVRAAGDSLFDQRHRDRLTGRFRLIGDQLVPEDYAKIEH